MINTFVDYFKPPHYIFIKLLVRCGRILPIQLLVCVGLSIGFSLSAQSNANDFDITYYGLNNPISTRNIEDMCQDQHGIIWIVGQQGLYYDKGNGIEKFDFAKRCAQKGELNYLTEILHDQKGNLWITGKQGLFIINSERNQLLNPTDFGIPDSIAKSPSLHFAPKQNGDMYVSTGFLIYHYTYTTQTLSYRATLQPKYASYLKRILYSPKDDLLCVIPEIPGMYMPVYMMDISGKRTYSVDSVTYIEANTPKEIKHIGESTFRYAKGEDNSMLWCSASGLNKIAGVSADRTNLLWEGTYLHNQIPEWTAVLAYFRNGQVEGFAKPTEQDGISVKSILKDLQGEYWFNTNLGLFHVRAKAKVRFHAIEALQNKVVRSINHDKNGNLLVGTYQGFFKYNLATKKLKEIYLKGIIWSFLPLPNGQYWLLKEMTDGLTVLDADKDKEIAYTSNHMITDGSTDFGIADDNKVWMAILGEDIGLFDKGNPVPIKVIKLKGGDIRTARINAFHYSSDGSLWIGTNNGLYRYRNAMSDNPYWDSLGVMPSLRHIPINALYEDNASYLWVATAGWGLYEYHYGRHELFHYDVSSGLSNNMVYSIMSSHQDSILWLGTQYGLSCLDVENAQFYNYYKADGLAQNEFNANADYIASDGTYYIGGMQGVTYFKPFLPFKDEHSLLTFLDVKISNNDNAKNRYLFPEQEQIIQIYPQDLYVEIQIHTSELFEAQNVNYRYKIDNNLSDWVYLGHNNKISLASLSPGQYKLNVQSLSPHGAWGETRLLILNVNPPFYKTWWFYGLCVFLFAALVYGFFRMHVARLNKEFALRAKISNDLHDSLGGRLYVLKRLASQISNSRQDEQEKRSLLKHFDVLCKDSIQTIRDFIWAFNPENNHLSDLAQRMEDFADNTVKPIIRNTVFVAQEALDHRRISPSVAHHSLMIYQELITNMIKHTNCEALDIDIRCHNHLLVIIITNKHNGYVQKISNERGVGTKSIDKRLDSVAGRLEWLEMPNQQKAIVMIPKNQ